MVAEEIQTKLAKKVCLSCSREFTGVVSSCPHDGTVLIPLAQDPLIGTKLADRYQILALVGQGGMGNVYRARHELMERDVAIKMLKAEHISDSASVKRFQQEARAACRLKHPNVITLFDFGVSPSGQPYLVMDYLTGISLSDVIKKDGHVGVDRSIRIFIQACRALEQAHRAGVIHRDLKPGNIMLIETDEEKDFVKVVDFGVAKLIGGGDDAESQRLTQTGEVCGSPVYMSPEQCMGQRLGPPSDIYAMGVVLYEALTGRLPLLGKTMVDTMSKHISEMPPSFSDVRPDLYIPERLEAVVFKALKKNPEERHQSMAELERELELAIPKPQKSQAMRTTIQPSDGVKIPLRTASSKTGEFKAPTRSASSKSGELKAPKPPIVSAPPPKREGLPAAVYIVAGLAVVGGLVFWLTTSKPSTVPAAIPPSTRAPNAVPATTNKNSPEESAQKEAKTGADKKKQVESKGTKESGAGRSGRTLSKENGREISKEAGKETSTEAAKGAEHSEKSNHAQATAEAVGTSSARRGSALAAHTVKTTSKPHQPAKKAVDDPFAELARSRSYKQN